jgi:hypothetical protein
MDSPSSLDLFLLGLINYGINTPYLFRERAMLSVGATLPALNRLEEARLVRRQARAQRNRQEFSLTRSGKQYLTSELNQLLDHYGKNPPADAESVLRAVSLGIVNGQTKAALTCLQSAARDRKRRSLPQPLATHDIKAPNLSEAYSHWLSLVQTARLRSEGESFSNLLSDLSRQKKVKRKNT